ncbi:MAG: lamin tail domain-containing protein, partial [Pedobacter sp.]
MKNIGPASGNFAGTDGAPLSVLRVQQKMNETVAELDRIYKLDAAFMGYNNNVYNQWKTVDHPRILAQVPERVSFNLNKWKEYNMAHTLSAANIITADVITEAESIQIINSNSGTQLYYTLNGTDPMGNDGVVSANAYLYNTAFTLPAGNYNIVTRAFTTNNWGPIASKTVKVEKPRAGKFVITGINYKPLSNADAEFLLISNTGTADLDVSGYTISDAVTYTFPQGTVIAQNQTIMLAKNLSLISGFVQYSKYQWTTGSLNNSGESTTFKDSLGNTIDNVTYGSVSPWPIEANGQGYYLKLIAPDLDNTLPASWESVSLIATSAKMSSSKSIDKTEGTTLKSIK